MRFPFTKNNLTPQENFRQRIFEVLPGALSWTIILGLILLSFTKPLVAAILIIAFDFYWFLRLLYMTIFLLLSYWRLTCERETDWLQRVHEVDAFVAGRSMPSRPFPNGRRQRHSADLHRTTLAALADRHSLPPNSSQIYHLVILPIAKEPKAIIEPALCSIAKQDFPAKQIFVILALEESAPEQTRHDVHELAQLYQNRFLDLLTIVHPRNTPGEARVKGANATYAAKKAAHYFQERHIPFSSIVVSCFDADTIVEPEYFSCLTYYFMTTPGRTRASFQPIPVYHNNIWQVPGFARVMETGASFFQLIESTNVEKLVTFSSHSMSFQALVEVGYWPVDMISDDSAIFWKSFIHYNGRYRVIPMYITLSMDVAAADTLWQTIKSIYKQKRRWAWGIENFPIVMRAFLRTKRISGMDKLRYGFKLLEGNISWATWGFILTIIGWIPTVFSSPRFRNSVIYYTAPEITGTIFHLASLSLFTSVLLSIALLPRQKVENDWFKKTLFVLEWLMIPFILVFLSSLPALDAQTRLMLGKRMEFFVTDKRRRART